jgi:hypothetical protein
VTYRDVGTGDYVSTGITIPSSNYKTSDLQINQAIKAAINSDAVLGKLLVAEDGPNSTLVVRALTDGNHVAATDLAVAFTVPAASSYTAADVTAFKAAYTADLLAQGYTPASAAAAVDALAITNAASLQSWIGTQLAAANLTTTGGYAPAFATDGSTEIQGANSSHISDNVILGEAGNDVIVLGTGVGSNDIIRWEGFGNGTDTIVNFVSDTTAVPTGTYQPAVVTIDLTGVWAAVDGAATGDGTFSLVLGSGVTGTITPGAAFSTFADDAAIATAIRAETPPTGWVWGGSGATVTLTQSTGATLGTNPTAVLSLIGDTTGAANTTYTTTNDFDDAYALSGIGADQLDFSSYGAVALFIGETYTASGFTSSVSLGSFHNYATGEAGQKYITLEQVNNRPAGTYEIVLWQDAATTLPVGSPAAAEFDNTGSTDVKLGIIGIVDLGAAAVAGFNLANADFILAS